MILDANELAEATLLTADVCVIGGGPAGLTLASDLVDSGLSVLVLESGGDDWDEETQALAKGDVVGRPLLFNGVEMPPELSRLRQLGGTSNHWTGQCRPLDALDFEVRPAIPNSGWPIDRTDLDPYYLRAVASCGLASDRFDGAWWSEQAGTPLLVDGDPVRTVMFQFSPPVRFGPALRPRLAAAQDVQVVLWANVTAIETDPSGRSVEGLRVATLAGRTWSVEAARYVLAVGGIETPRLLLASGDVSEGGVGNGNDLVGRYFMDHPHVGGGRAAFSVSDDDWRTYRIGPLTPPGGATSLCWGGLSLSARTQSDAGVGNASMHFWEPDAGPDRGDRDAQLMSVQAVDELLLPVPPAPTHGVISIRAEQIPNPESRVTLGDEVDALGMPRAVVDWQLTEGDVATIRSTAQLIAQELGARGLARLEVDPSGVPLQDWPIEIGNHHMGTTRMHADPRSGVVDENCRMHEVGNLFICGSAVFTTSGMANPTLTIVALAHRLADHLKQ